MGNRRSRAVCLHSHPTLGEGSAGAFADATVPAVQLSEAVAVVRVFSARLVANSDALDALNVFPIADNDTGANMAHTLGLITAALEDATSLDEASRLVESAALGGRGNSGLIVGQYLAGFFASVDGGGIDIARGLGEGARWARRAVANPVEGTMLTVADVGASALQATPELTLDALAAIVAAAVEATTDQLAVLAESNVVDSGAAGLLLFFEALRDVVGGDASTPIPGVIACNVGLDVPGEQAASFEIQFRVPVSLIDRDELRSLLIGLGTDVVIASSTDELSAHLHVSDPHAATAVISATIERRPGAKAISYEVEPIIDFGPRS